jgi:hypothetical protein
MRLGRYPAIGRSRNETGEMAKQEGVPVSGPHQVRQAAVKTDPG